MSLLPMSEVLAFVVAARQVVRRILPVEDVAAERELHMALAGWLCSLSLNAPMIGDALRHLRVAKPLELVASTYARVAAGQRVYGERMIRDKVARARVPVEEQKELARAVRALQRVQTELRLVPGPSPAETHRAEALARAEKLRRLSAQLDRTLSLVQLIPDDEQRALARRGLERTQKALGCGVFIQFMHCPTKEHEDQQLMRRALRCGSPLCGFCAPRTVDSKVRACVKAEAELREGDALRDVLIVRAIGGEGWTPERAGRVAEVFRARLRGPEADLRDPEGITFYCPVERAEAAHAAAARLMERGDALGVVAVEIRDEDQQRIRRESLDQHRAAEVDYRDTLMAAIEDAPDDAISLPVEALVAIGADQWLASHEAGLKDRDVAAKILPWPSKTAVRQQLKDDAWASRGFAEVPDLACPEADPADPGKICGRECKHGYSDALTGRVIGRRRDNPVGIREAIRHRCNETGAWHPPARYRKPKPRAASEDRARRFAGSRYASRQ